MCWDKSVLTWSEVETAGGTRRRVYRREHCSHCGTACVHSVCAQRRKNEVCHCHRSVVLLRQQSRVLVYSAIFTLGTILRSVITHLWQRSRDPVRNEWYQGHHRPALTRMDGSSKRDKLPEMQPLQASHKVVFKEGAKDGRQSCNCFINYKHRLCLKVVYGELAC